MINKENREEQLFTGHARNLRSGLYTSARALHRSYVSA
jgi:hypothetical protein